MSIICLGDFGMGNKDQYEVAELLNYIIKEKKNIKLILGLGDNFYPEGVTSVNDTQFKTKFLEPYKKIPKNIKFFNVLGNHDYMGKIKPQINFTYNSRLNTKSQWILPHNFYCFKKKINNIEVEFFAIDTNLSELSAKVKKIQEEWIMEALELSTANWIIIFGHHPWKSTGSHGNCSDELNEFYEKITKTNKIDLICTGHDHDQQLIHIPNLPHLIISGTGSKSRGVFPLFRMIQPNLKFYSEKLGCCVINFINSKNINIEFFNSSNKIEFQYKIKK